MRAYRLALVVLLAAGCGEPTVSVHRGDNSLQDLNQAMQKRATPVPGPTMIIGRA